jgi:RNA polymerase sigma-70 factor (ECF subfamily)
MTTPVDQTIARVVRDEWPQLMATLYRDLGDLDAAQDAAQEAAEIALTRWLDDGIPDRPGAWITTVARRRALDKIRREQVGREKTELFARLERIEHEKQPTAPHVDDQLQLFFGCCHPALSIEAQMALTLRSVGGLTTTEIARGFLVTEATMAQRLVRAKRKIAGATIPFRIPDGGELLDRLTVVHHVLYLVFNEGAYASTGHDLLRVDLSAEAIRLTRVLASVMPDDPETLALLALFLFIESRREARVDDTGAIVLMAEQDRTRWCRPLIDEAAELIDRAVRLDRPGPYQIEAAINSLHAEALDADDTDWAQIVLLYESLAVHRPTPVVALNHAVAVAMHRGPQAGLDLMDHPSIAEPLDLYHYLHSARGELSRQLGNHRAAADSYHRALELVNNDTERRFLRERLRRLV